MAVRAVPISHEEYLYYQVMRLAQTIGEALYERYPQLRPWLLIGSVAAVALPILNELGRPASARYVA